MKKTVPQKAQSKVVHMAFDQTTPRLYSVLKKRYKKLGGTSLDSTHLSINVDRFTSKRKDKPKPSMIGLVVRSIMSKFDMPDSARKKEPYYTGQREVAPSK